MSLSSNKVLRAFAITFQIVVALVFLFAATIKAFHPAGFADEIAAHGLLPAAMHLPAAWFFISLEFMLAIGLLFNLKPRLFLPMMLATLLGFIGVTAYLLVQGINVNCGCFGNVIQRTPEQVIIEDAVMFVALLFSYIILFDDRKKKSWVKIFSFSGGALAIALLLTGLSAQLPVDSFVTELKEGRMFTSWPIEGMFLDLNKEQRVVFLFSTKDAEIEQQIQRMNAIAQTENIPTCVGLIVDGSEQLGTLVFQYGTAFPVGALEPRFAKQLYRFLPRTFILDHGFVKSVWNGVPSPDDVKTKLILMKK